MPNIFEVSDAAGDISTTYTLTIGSIAQGTITAGDHDYYRINLVQGQIYSFAMVGSGVNNVNDTYLRLLNSAGTEITNNDDGLPKPVIVSRNRISVVPSPLKSPLPTVRMFEPMPPT